LTAKSLIYEVSLEVDPAAVARFDPWLAQHVQEMLRIEGFLSADIQREEPEDARPRRVILYRMRDEQALETYLSDHADGMRQKGLAMFGDAFTASRRTYLVAPGPRTGQLVIPDLGYDLCLNCEAPLLGSFCSACGQRNRRRLPRVLEMLGEVLGEVLEYDSRFWKTLWPLLRRPGHLTREFIDGRRVKFLPPVRMFLVLSIVFFALSGLTDADTDSVTVDGDGEDVELVQDSDPPDAPAPDEWVVDADGYPFLDDPELQDRLVRQLAKIQEEPGLLVVAMARELPTMMLVFLPVLALVLQLLYPIAGHRYVEHLIFSIHYHSFFFLQIILVMLLGRLSNFMQSTELTGAGLMEVAFGLSVAAVVIWTPIYLFRSLRRVYQQGRLMTTFKFLLLIVSYLVSLALTSLVTAVIAGLSL
jgi:quinol monooxygenase YgiN